MRALNVGRALQELGHVEMVVINGEGWEQQWVESGNKEFEVAYSLPVHLRPNRTLAQKASWVFDPRATYPHGCGVDDEATRRVLRSADDFDMIWFCKLRTSAMFPRWAWSRSVADIDDVPSTYERSVLVSEAPVRERLSSLARFLSWRRRDRLLGDRFTVLGVCSEGDRRYLQALGVSAPLHVIPNGSDRPPGVPPRNRATPPRIGFIGIFDYAPNLQGIQWFATECWPRIKRRLPDARLRLVGRFSDGPLKPVGPDIDGLGWLPDLGDEVATWSAMVVPIRVGAGTRGKIAHAFSLKCPVVSTSLGAYGYEAKDGHAMRLGDSAESFSNACINVIEHPDAADRMADRAWQEFLENWTWDAIRPRVWAAAEDCLRRSART